VLRHGWPVTRAEELVKGLAEATEDEDGASARAAIVASTAARLQKDEPCQGWPSLAKLLGEDNAREVRLALDCGLTVEALAEVKRLPPDFLTELGVTDDAEKMAVAIPYRDATERVIATRYRYSQYSLEQRPRWEKGAKAVPYGADRLAGAVEAGSLTLVEGESDCWTLWSHNVPCLGIPGAECAGVLQAGHVTPFSKLYVVQEPGPGGEAFLDGVRQRLAEIGWKGELRCVRLDGLKGPSELHIDDPDRFKARWAAAMEAAEIVSLPPASPIAPRPAPLPYRPFPVEALPVSLAVFVCLAAAALGCDPAYVALPCLATAAALIGNSRAIRLKRAWTGPCVVWAAVIGDSGTLKSPAQRQVIAPVYRLQRELLGEYEKARAAHEAARAQYEKLAKAASKAGKPLDDVLPDAPTPCRVVTGDVTIEKLGLLLAENPRGMLVCRDELRSWFASFTRYKGQTGGSDLSQWLEFFRAEAVIIDRKTTERPTLLIPQAAVSVCGGIQPGTWGRVLTKEHFEAGLVARLVVAMPSKLQKRWRDAEIDPTTQHEFEALLRKLFALKPDQDEQGDPVPFIVKLTPEAKAAWVKFYDEWAARQAEAEGELAACLAKLEAYAARFALVHHIVSRVAEGRDDCDPVEVASIEAGATLASWFAYEAERAYAVGRCSDEERQMRRLLEYIQGHGGEVTPRTLHKANRSKYLTPEAAEAALEALVRGGLGTWVPSEGGRPSRKFRLHPDAPCPKSPESPLMGRRRPTSGRRGVRRTIPQKVPHRLKSPRKTRLLGLLGHGVRTQAPRTGRRRGPQASQMLMDLLGQPVKRRMDQWTPTTSPERGRSSYDLHRPAGGP
jgi:hypothetical protein